MELTINNKKYNVKFGYGALRLLADKWGVKSPGQLDKNFSKLDIKKGKEPSFDQLNLIGDIIAAGAEYGSGKADFTTDEVLDSNWQTPEIFTQVLELFAASMPQQELANPAVRGKKKG